MNHLYIDKHMQKPQRLTLHDTAIQMYKQTVEERQVYPNLPILNEALQGFWDYDNNSDVETLQTGWVLRTRKSCKKIFVLTGFVLDSKIQPRDSRTKENGSKRCCKTNARIWKL